MKHINEHHLRISPFKGIKKKKVSGLILNPLDDLIYSLEFKYYLYSDYPYLISPDQAHALSSKLIYPTTSLTSPLNVPQTSILHLIWNLPS